MARNYIEALGQMFDGDPALLSKTLPQTLDHGTTIAGSWNIHWTHGGVEWKLPIYCDSSSQVVAISDPTTV